jgi:cyclase
MLQGELRRTKVSDAIMVFDGHYGKLNDYAEGNVTATIIRSGNDVFVFDSMLHPEDTMELLQSLKRLNLNVKGLINTHWHLDHIAGNQLFLETKRIMSHSLCSELMHKDLPDQMNDWNKEAKGENKIRPVYPNEAVSDGSILNVGDRANIEFFHTPGHTPDSIIGWLKNEQVVIAGDTVMEVPFIGYGDSRALISSLKRIESIAGAKGKIIQGHGGICEGAKLVGDIRYLENLNRIVAEHRNAGKTAEEAVASIKLADCVSEESFRSLSPFWRSLGWLQSANVKRIYAELGG